MLASRTTRGGRIDTEPSFFRAVWEQKWVVLAVVGVAAAIGLLATFVQPTTYRSDVDVLFIDPNTAGQLTAQMGLERNQGRHVANQAEILVSEPVARAAAELLGGRLNSASVMDSVSADPGNDRDIVVLTATRASAGESAEVASAVVDAYRSAMGVEAAEAWRQLTDQNDQRTAAIEAQMTALDAEIEANPNASSLRNQQAAYAAELRLIRQDQAAIDRQLEAFGDGVQSASESSIADQPTSPTPARNMLIAVVVGFLVALGVVWVRS